MTGTTATRPSRALAKVRMRESRLSLRSVFGADPIDRRRELKRILYRMPMRPSIYFLYLYFVRMGFIDGRAGLAFCRMRASYEFIIDLKVLELERTPPYRRTSGNITSTLTR